jgi:hypothetical protein
VIAEGSLGRARVTRAVLIRQQAEVDGGLANRPLMFRRTQIRRRCGLADAVQAEDFLAVFDRYRLRHKAVPTSDPFLDFLIPGARPA